MHPVLTECTHAHSRWSASQRWDCDLGVIDQRGKRGKSRWDLTQQLGNETWMLEYNIDISNSRARIYKAKSCFYPFRSKSVTRNRWMREGGQDRIETTIAVDSPDYNRGMSSHWWDICTTVWFKSPTDRVACQSCTVVSHGAVASFLVQK